MGNETLKIETWMKYIGHAHAPDWGPAGIIRTLHITLRWALVLAKAFVVAAFSLPYGG